jgi:hypothetical protein
MHSEQIYLAYSMEGIKGTETSTYRDNELKLYDSGNEFLNVQCDLF